LLQCILQAAVQQQSWHAGQKVRQVEPQQYLWLLKLLVELMQEGGYGCPWDLVPDLQDKRAGKGSWDNEWEGCWVLHT
jgi:hypothetical protein